VQPAPVLSVVPFLVYPPTNCYDTYNYYSINRIMLTHAVTAVPLCRCGDLYNQISSSMDGMPGIETKNNLGPSIGLSITGNTITGSAGVAIWLLCDNGCTYGSTISGNTLSGNAGTGNFCNGMIQEDDLGGNNIINC